MDKFEINYPEREQASVELNEAIADILSAERQAKASVEQAEQSVNAIRLDGAARERELREMNNRAMTAAREKALADAAVRAEKERKSRVEQAEKAGGELVASKKKQIDKRIAELYASLGGKR